MSGGVGCGEAAGQAQGAVGHVAHCACSGWLVSLPLVHRHTRSYHCHRRLESLELEKGAYDRQELDALSSNLPALRRLVLAGGLVGSPMHEWSVLSHGGLQELVLEAGRAVRLTIRAHQLTSLRCGPGAGGTMGRADEHWHSAGCPPHVS